MRFDEELSRALTGRWRKAIWRPFMRAIREYELVEADDNIAVCVSGGKDSMLLAKCMQELRRHSPLEFGLRFLCMDPGYSPEARARIEENAKLLGIPLEFFETDIFAAVAEMDCKPCFMCAKMRRGYLYRRAKELSCNKIALGHHFDDAIETLLMSMLYAGQLRGMRPMIASDNVPGMRLIRPLYEVREADIEAWRDFHGLAFLPCSCKFAERSADSKRREAKALIRQIADMHPEAPANIFRSAHNAMLNSLNGWKQGGAAHSFLEEFRIAAPEADEGEGQ